MELRICKWLDDQDFREIVRIASYRGRDRGCSVFYIDPARIERRISEGENIDYVVEILRSYVDSEEALREVERLIQSVKEKYRVTIKFNGNYFLLCSRARLLDYLAEFRNSGVKYDRVSKCFTIPPYLLSPIIERIRREGLEVDDETGLTLASNRYHWLKGYKMKVGLRPYQEEALKRWIDNSFRGVIALPTGAGKTIVGLAAITEIAKPVLIVVYTREQLHQWRDMVRRYTDIPSYMVQLFYGAQKSIGPVTITTYQTAFRNTGKLAKQFSLMIIDEVHHLPADKFRKIALEVLAPYRMGLSATPYREDGRHEELFRLMGGLVYYASQRELAEQGFLAKFSIIPVLVSLTKKEYREYREYYKKFIEVARGADIDELVRLAGLGSREAKEALSAINKARKLLLYSKAKREKLREIVEEEKRKGSKIIVFVPYVDVAEDIAKLLGVQPLTGRTSEDKRKRLLEDFRACRLDVLVMTTVGDEGIDLPDANVGIMVSVTGSKRQFVQRLGRLLRPGKGKESRLYILAVKNTFEERQLKKKLEALKELIE